MQRDLKELGVRDFMEGIPKGTPMRHRASFKRFLKALNGLDREGGGTLRQNFSQCGVLAFLLPASSSPLYHKLFSIKSNSIRAAPISDNYLSIKFTSMKLTSIKLTRITLTSIKLISDTLSLLSNSPRPNLSNFFVSILTPNPFQ